jgi:anti-sigma regulatory factor (Ser/Thr protein kinase)
VVCELAGNVLKHSGRRARVSVAVDKDAVFISVKGGKPFEYTARESLSSEDETGKGIYIVNSLCRSMDYRQGGRDVTVSLERHLTGQT